MRKVHLLRYISFLISSRFWYQFDINRYEADKSCRSTGGHLLHVTSEEQQQLALALYDKDAVSGLLAADGGLWMALNGNQWRWITGIVFIFFLILFHLNFIFYIFYFFCLGNEWKLGIKWWRIEYSSYM